MYKRLLQALTICVLLTFCISSALALPQSTDIITYIDQPQVMPFWDLEQSLQVYCIPIGAQDCYLVVADGHAMVLDCGAVGREPTPDLLITLLQNLGIDHLDYAFNTHPHRDHIDGYEKLLAAIPADEFVTAFPADYSRDQRRSLQYVKELGIPVRAYAAGDPLPLGTARISTYQYRQIKNTNDLSLVVRIEYGKRSILFTADIGLTAQRKLAEEFADEWKSDIFKLPHHGIGGLSIDLFNAASPELCFVSNWPNSTKIPLQRDLVTKHNTPILYTYRQPLVMITDGQTWQVQQWQEDSIQLPNFTLIAPKES